MKLETLNERIQNAEQKIEKKQNTIEKKTALIAKKEKSLSSLSENDKYWTECDIRHLREDIERGAKEIEEIKKSLESYRAQLNGEQEREKLLREVPETLKSLQNELVTRWDAYDKERRDMLKLMYIMLDWKEFHKRYGRSAREEKDRTDEQIHSSNVEDAKALILNLIYRVRDHVGTITDWSHIEATAGNMGAVLNGYVAGTEGRCIVESIGAGGYNIQRYHIRVLVKEFK